MCYFLAFAVVFGVGDRYVGESSGDGCCDCCDSGTGVCVDCGSHGNCESGCDGADCNDDGSRVVVPLILFLL